jgi:serine/threonine-protein kinase HipA
MKIPNPDRCPGCYKPQSKAYCNTCQKKLFNGRKIAPVLDFSRPDFNAAKSNPASRISISGVQVKHSLKINKKGLELADQAGEYILKPIPNDSFENISEMPMNEHLTMQIARQVFKMSVAENALVFFNDGEPAYLTKRFDRDANGRKLLQEDFAQLSRRSEESHGSNYKYGRSSLPVVRNV